MGRIESAGKSRQRGHVPAKDAKKIWCQSLNSELEGKNMGSKLEL
jgi:hypothetical protein